ncbi:3'-to-5' oligoribonuclease A [Pediococcus damnosus]|uniref:3'-to-5' oligoribonuclease A n=1 Tax=Pediococcus damnosus TaxID=51663 RepID=A0A0R2HAL8_9LACO|nr:bifunctional oligoribonuclease/PAP phosphatase NrnA [Pediococcus damnosus]AMV62410.1 3'-to-5' oligoribonuclease A [Pediococcus damnosus]AMV67726.1 3'-to-5' oligoribonuclease A [Pediococcus damnosus]AMV68946.1 3'-to-5' oligoribonuclease A [Pediococcus damnosus]KJU73742.1 oligoribonuclease [Pediococcus damnosus LMG 28219]KRN47493.1 phosphoesterase, DHH family protein [Pediococcus damnosus]
MTLQQEIFEQIKKHQRIIIHRHQRPDPDAIGSQIGLAEIIRASFPMKTVLAVGKQIGGLSWIGEMDTADDDDYDDALVIVTDTANPPRVDDNRYTNGQELIKIDHHPDDDPYGDLAWVVPSASSSSEMIFDLYHQFKHELTLNAKAAKALYAGIIGDTGRFLYSATTPHTMRVAASLMATGFDVTAVNQKLDSIPLSVAHLSAYVYQNLTITEDGAATVCLTSEVLDQFDLKDAGTAGVVPLPGKIESVVCWAIFVVQRDGTYRVRLRSKGPTINELAKKHDGGGHALASGAKAKDLDEVQTIQNELAAIATAYKKSKKE